MKTIVKHLIPNAGTLLIVGLLFLAQSAGALPSAAPASTQAPSQTLISYQGTLTDPGGNPINGTVPMQFAFYDAATGGTLLWGPEGQNVEVASGLFNVLLGSVTPIDPASLTGDLWLDITVGGERLSPRELLASVVHAVQATGIAGNLDLRGYRLDNANRVSSQDNTDLTIDAGQSTVGTLTLLDSVSIPNGDLDMGGHWINNVVRLTSPEGVNLDIDASFPGQGTLSLLDDVKIPYGDLNMGGNTVYNCGALVEANLQTKEELAADHIDRFEEGDVLCWAGERLEKCAIANDRLVQAVADHTGRPIIIGAEPVKVIGPVRAGDYLVASSVPGYAMVAPNPTFGTVIAQALEDFDGERGIIKAMIRKM